MSGTQNTFYQIYKTINNNQQRKSQHLKQRTVNEQLQSFAFIPRMDCQKAQCVQLYIIPGTL